MTFNKQICMLIYVNQKSWGKINSLKTNLYIKNININIKNKTNRPLTENPSTRKPGEKKPHSTPTSIVNPKQVI